jgi:flavin reductase (DIM6/NTAB) family NADH-FMN oxidoreductase RutF
MSVASISPLQPSEPAVTEVAFRDFCRKLTAGVAVVTSSGAAWSGTTVSTVTSVSMNPPVLLFCISSGSGTLAAIRRSGRFAVHLLSERQPSLADRFSRPTGSQSRFVGEELDAQLVGGVPVISEVLAVGWCAVHTLHEVGDHVVVYGCLSSASVGQGTPLVWHNRDYRRLGSASPQWRAP